MAETRRGNGWVVKDFSKEFLRSAQNEVERAVARGTIRVQAEAKRLTSQKSGPTKSNPAAPPSAPGEPPHVRTATLTRSIDSETFERGGTFFGRIGTNVKYGFWLEGGTRKMAPRPYLRPALDSQLPKIMAEMRRAGRRMRSGRG